MPTKKVCPKCRDYNVERQWCDLCNKTGVVDPRPVIAQDYADLLAEEDKLQFSNWLQQARLGSELTEAQREHRIDDLIDDWMDTLATDQTAIKPILRQHYARYSDEQLNKEWMARMPEDEE